MFYDINSNKKKTNPSFSTLLEQRRKPDDIVMGGLIYKRVTST